jgi:hypothetical protein
MNHQAKTATRPSTTIHPTTVTMIMSMGHRLVVMDDAGAAITLSPLYAAPACLSRSGGLPAHEAVTSPGRYQRRQDVSEWVIVAPRTTMATPLRAMVWCVSDAERVVAMVTTSQKIFRRTPPDGADGKCLGVRHENRPAHGTDGTDDAADRAVHQVADERCTVLTDLDMSEAEIERMTRLYREEQAYRQRGRY